MRVAGPEMLSRTLRTYGVTDTRPFLEAWHAYVNARRAQTNNNRYKNAKRAGIRLTNGIFETYERSKKQSGPIVKGLRNGAIQSLLWWTPGVMARRAIPMIANLN
jgi:hypothetical protein